jgi:cold shock CspA family protein
MSGAYFYGTMRRRPPAAGIGKSGPPDRRGTRATGRISKLFIGQGYGFIRLASAREVFFHRGDLDEHTPFNDLHVGDAVVFELLEDTVSGARALHVARRTRTT